MKGGGLSRRRRGGCWGEPETAALADLVSEGGCGGGPRGRPPSSASGGCAAAATGTDRHGGTSRNAPPGCGGVLQAMEFSLGWYRWGWIRSDPPRELNIHSPYEWRVEGVGCGFPPVLRGLMPAHRPCRRLPLGWLLATRDGGAAGRLGREGIGGDQPLQQPRQYHPLQHQAGDHRHRHQGLHLRGQVGGLEGMDTP